MIMKWLESFKEERLLKKQEEQELIDLYEAVVLRFYSGPDCS
jgi:hypothetical protein